MNKKQSSSSYGIYGVITVAVVLLIAIAVNLLFSLIPDSVKKIDLSTEKLSEVSDEAKKYLESALDSEISLYLVAESGTEDTSISEFLSKLSALDERISLETVDPTVKRTFIENLTGESPDELSDNTIIVLGKKYSSVKIISPENLYSYEAFVVDAESESFVSYGEYSYREFVSVYTSLSEYFSSGYAYYDTKFNGETVIISAIDYVLSDPEKLPKVYFTAMHGESAVSDSLAELLELSNLPCDGITLAQDIPSDTGIIVMNAPITDLSEMEAERLEKYLADGGKLFVITSHTKVKSLENLAKVLEKYGLSAESNEIYESDSSYHYPAYENFILPDPGALEALYGVEHYYFLASSAHAINKNAELTDITYTDLLQTTDKAYYITDKEDTKSEAAQYSLAVSALAKDGGEVVWFACPYMLSDEDNEMVGGGNYIHFTAILSSLCERHSVVFASKVVEQDVMTISSSQASFWAIVLIAVIPSVFLTVGFVKVRSRKKA